RPRERLRSDRTPARGPQHRPRPARGAGRRRARPSDALRVQGARTPRRAAGRSRVAAGADAAPLGGRARPGRARLRGSHLQPPAQDRRRPDTAGAAPHRARRGLPPRARLMRRLGTPLADRLGVRFPIVQAPMAYVSPPALAIAVSNAGALGSIAGAPLSPDEL